ncbi:MAG: low molecular weight protein-tyrosine-phosphatase [Cyclobacteriaceae bacterium]
MIKIIFVCLGNICRSPLGEAICRHKIKALGLEDKIKCDSAGTANYHVGDPPDPRSVQSAIDHGIPIDHNGQQFTKRLSTQFDYLIAMDQSNYRNMVTELGEEPDSLYLMRHFDLQNPDADVPDPYYGGSDGFENVYQILDRSVDELLKFVIERHKLNG